MRSFLRFFFAFLCCGPGSIAWGGAYPGGSATQSFDYPDATVEFTDGAVFAFERLNAADPATTGVYQRSLRLADKNAPGQISSFKLPDLDPNNVLRGFDLTFNVAMEKPAAGEPGEGWSVNFGRVPRDNGTGEGGFAPLPGGLTIAFDPFDENGGGSFIEVSVGGIPIGRFSRPFVYAALFRPVVIHWDQAGLDLAYDGKVVCVDLPTPGFAPGAGHRFAFTARTATLAMEVLLDNLRVITQSSPVLETGGPVISEFAAVNADFEDEFADKPAWIEVMNGSSAAVDLAGWYLTDSKTELTRWRIPSVSLTPYNYLVIFASGRDRPFSSTSLMHAGFKLSRGGGYLALVKPDGKTVASAYEYGAQEKGASFGEQGPERRRGFMAPPTPGAVNTQPPSDASFSPNVEFSHPGGFLNGSASLVLSVAGNPDAVIRYTLDRTEPRTSSPVFSAPIPISRLTMVRARSYAPGHLPGRIASRTFVRMDDSLSNYNGSGKVFDSNLPLVFLESFGLNVDGSTGSGSPFRPSYVVVIPPDARTGRAALTSTPDYAGPGGVHVRGESSGGFDQRSYALELRDEGGVDLDAPLLGMPADSDWVLYGPWSEKTFMRNKLIFDWMRALRGPDGTAMRSRFIELFFNQSTASNGQVGYGSYRGIYLLMEKMKRGKDRVPLENLNAKTTDPGLITGGYIFRKDKDDALKTKWNSSRLGIALQSFDPDQLNSAQSNYLKGYIASFETSLLGSNSRNLMTGYRAFVDPDSFIDAQWMLEIAKQVDGYVFSTYFHKDRAGRLRAGPLWDFNISLGNADYASGDRPTGWLYDATTGIGQDWYPKLHADPEYRLAHWDRYWEMRRTLLATEKVMAVIDGHMQTLLDGHSGAVSNRAPAEIQNPVARHFRRWPRLGVRDWPNPPAETSIRTWQAEVAYLKNWIKPRLEWLDDQSLRNGTLVYRPPVLSHEGGVIDAPIRLNMAAFTRVQPPARYAQGEIYYTLDGSDPRLPESAFRYSGPVSVGASMTVNARLLSQGQWSPLASATYFLNAVPASRANVVISEILFRPAPPSQAESAAGLLEGAQFEYLELMNVSDQAVDLSGVKFERGLEFDFAYVSAASRLLAPGASAVLVADKRAFAIRYPNVPAARVLGSFRGQLDNSGETLSLVGADGRIIQEFRYDTGRGWPELGDAEGRSYVLKSPRLKSGGAEPARWIASAKVGGTPGVSGDGAERFGGDPGKDSDGDGVRDLLEFISGSDPENPASRFPIAPRWVQAATPYVVLEVHRNPNAKGVLLRWEFSRDLSTWENAERILTLMGTKENGDGTVTESYRVAAPIGEAIQASAFFRMAVRLE